jgi:NADPH-dependent curcumin reductase CurA
MDDAKSYAKPVQIGEVMGGGTVGEVIESRHPGFAVGDRVLTGLGWQQYAATDGTGLQKITSPEVPLSAWLGAVGMPGVTAWYGLNRILEPASGQTLCVSAAAGAVGSVVGNWPRQPGAAWSASPAASASAGSSCRITASMPASTTRRDDWRRT